MKRTILSLAGIAAIALMVAGCGEESGINPTPGVTLGLTVSFDMTAPANTVPGDDDTQTISIPATAPDSVTVSSGFLMVRSVRLNEDAVSHVDTVITAADEDRDWGDASVRFQGPYVVAIDGGAFDLGTTTIPTGNYRQMTFVLQKARATDDLDGHDDLAGSSITVCGKVWRNGAGQRFAFSTDYTTELAVSGDFTVTESTAGNLTVQFAPLRWFNTGSHWLDPDDTANRLQILRGIRRSVSGGLGPAN
jgi:hypothetical protein